MKSHDLMNEVIRGTKIGDFCDLIVDRANATCGVTAPLGKPEPVSRLGPDGRPSTIAEKRK